MSSAQSTDPPPGAREWIEESRGSAVRELAPLRGGAGRRRYWRARLAGGETVILMHALAEDPAILPPALRQETDAIPFVEVTHFLAGHELPVPTLYDVRAAERWVLLEDLGSCHLADLDRSRRLERSAEAIELLARVHRITHSGDALPFRRRFDAEWVGFELKLFLDGIESKTLRSELEAACGRLATAIAALPVCLCLRDYQSHNLMIDAEGRLRVIDYQDALLAPPELDLVALLWDSYVELEPDERGELLARYDAARAAARQPEALPMLAVQRKAKDWSRFRRLVGVQGEARFAPALEHARTAVLEALTQLPPAHRELAELVPRVFEELHS